MKIKCRLGFHKYGLINWKHKKNSGCADWGCIYCKKIKGK